VDRIEYLREKLYKAIETGNAEHILKTSQELDKLIFYHMELSINISKKSA